MSRTLRGVALGLALGVVALMPFSFHSDECDKYVLRTAWSELEDPSNPFGIAACDNFGFQWLDLVVLLYIIGVLGFGVVIAARMAVRNEILVASSVGVGSVLISKISGMLIANLPMSFLATDPIFYVSIMGAGLLGAIAGSLERSRKPLHSGVA
jgi:hypothetical protein